MRRDAAKYWPVLFLLFLAGCATPPLGPSVMVLPAPGKPFEQFVGEDSVCRQWAAQQLGEKPDGKKHTATGAAAGTLIGAGAGAALGAAAGDPGTGAAIGGGTGLLMGSAAGYSSGQSYASDMQRRYDMTYVQCMYAKGNQIPGVVSRGVKNSPPTPPPPSSSK
ncbi:glycine zipper family protein [Geomonas sp. RF6]|uniref:YMGG-like glycine zipper-containing protein n=1 Tax=Geomonas sp. RF6 TaxID=2897342 RepID=UPI001E62BC4B|nr:YMGG-like glycine zipper-containing protein [Geomonas sp. RF6]UFS69570.1 glycine zipper family protein [Geomonas sp. RF6]